MTDTRISIAVPAAASTVARPSWGRSSRYVSRFESTIKRVTADRPKAASTSADGPSNPSTRRRTAIVLAPGVRCTSDAPAAYASLTSRSTY